MGKEWRQVELPPAFKMQGFQSHDPVVMHWKEAETRFSTETASDGLFLRKGILFTTCKHS